MQHISKSYFYNFCGQHSASAAATQNQTFKALLLFFRDVLHRDLSDMGKTVRAKRGRRLPEVLSPAEVRAVLEAVKDRTYQLMARLRAVRSAPA